MNNKWDLRFLELCNHIGNWSHDPSTKVGSIIVDENRRIISTGYNGFPQKIDDDIENYNNRDIKYNMILHAEENALIFAKRDLSGCTIYTTPLAPCSRCASKIIQSGITNVVSVFSSDKRWNDSLEMACYMFTQSQISYKIYKDEKLYYWNKIDNG